MSVRIFHKGNPIDIYKRNRKHLNPYWESTNHLGHFYSEIGLADIKNKIKQAIKKAEG